MFPLIPLSCTYHIVLQCIPAGTAHCQHSLYHKAHTILFASQYTYITILKAQM